ncbi:M3 family oligoendopeptidase [bacterium]|nr:M3 family oligoendopeptidase [bacterium]
MSTAASMAPQGVTWDLSSYFPSYNGPEMLAFKQDLENDIAEVLRQTAGLEALNSGNINAWADVFLRIEDLNVRRGHLGSYLNNLASTDTQSEDYPQAVAALSVLGAQSVKIEVEFQRALKDCSDADFEALLQTEQASGAEYALRRMRFLASHSMSPAEEKLNADLAVDGIHAWGRLYDKVSGKLSFEMRWPDGRVESLPISRWRALMADSDFNVGRSAFEGGNATWEGVADTCAAALNGIAGWRLTLNRRRSYPHYLDIALFNNAISAASVDAMYTAIHEHIEIPREYYKAKARFTGRKSVWFFEREAQLPLEDSRKYSWNEGSDMVAGAFRSAYPALADYYSDFLDKRWMESESRGGKRPGAYCTGSALTREQRVYMTYNGTLGDVGTLAHEMGHAWHSHVLKPLRPVARMYPSTLAETASIFAEHILAQGMAGNSEVSATQKLMMLDESLSGAAIIILDIAVRYEFERAFHDERMKGEVSVSRLKELMVDTQQRIWGDALEPGGEDPLFWASKLHFYISQATFYNFPYTVGWMLARTLANKLRQEGPDFLSRYEDFLRLTGSATVEDVVQRSLGEDCTQPEFWAGAILSLQPEIEQFKQQLGALK